MATHSYGMGGGTPAQPTSKHYRPNLGGSGTIVPKTMPPIRPPVQPPPPPAPLPTGGMNITAQPSPEMAAATAEWKKRMAELQQKSSTPDPNLQWQINKYKERMAGDTTRQEDQLASKIRDQMAGMNAGADVTGVAMGRKGFGATGIAESGQRALAGGMADIQLGREAQLDALLTSGQGIMGAPGQQGLAYQGLMNNMYGQNPYMDTAQLGLAQQGLGLQAYIAQQQAQNDYYRTMQQNQPSPYEMYQMLYNL